MATLLAFVALASLAPAPNVKVVAGGPKDFMTVRHAVVRGSQEQIGAGLAAIWRANHGGKASRDKPERVRRRLAWLKKHWPQQYQRSLGVAKAIGRPPSDEGFDPTNLNYNLDVQPGCSVVYYPGSKVANGHAMLSRNYDFSTLSLAEMTGRKPPKGARAMTADPYVLECYPDNGYASLSLVSYDLLGACIDGVNEHGLAVALLANDQDGSTPPVSDGTGFDEISITKYLLERCRTAQEARRVLADAKYVYGFIPCHYMVGDASGDSFVWEITTDLKRRYVVDGRGKPQIVTNHLLARYDEANLPAGNSFDRFRRLQSELRARRGRIDPKEVRAVNLCVQVPKDARNAATLWHSVYDLKERKVAVSFFLGKSSAGERRTPYLNFQLRR